VKGPWLSELNLYPVKGCRRTLVARARAGARGLVGDREWMVVGNDGVFISQRSHPALARIVPRLSKDGLELTCAGHPPLAVAAPTADAARMVSVWRHSLLARDAGPAAADWLATVLGAPLRLVRIDPAAERYADRIFVGPRDVPVAFADGYPLLVCNSASLDELNRRLPTPVPMERFRPNLVLEGLAAFAEDGLAGVRVGALRLDFVKPCTRCTVPSIDQLSGEPSSDPTAALKEFRYDRQLRGVTFGVNAVVREGEGQELATGVAVEPLASAALPAAQSPVAQR
jgi:uncharacterized protein YcbX